MSQADYRIEHDSMGELKVPADALYGAQTQRAVQNFQISEYKMPREFIRALGLIKATAAHVNEALGLLDHDTAKAIIEAATEVAQGDFDKEFPIDVFQTGSGTSTNMNANEVIATLASKKLGKKVHPNDHVNMGMSSNDTIPTAVHVSASLMLREQLLPALAHFADVLDKKIHEVGSITKTGRTHLMDAMPITFAQELGGWKKQIELAISRFNNTQPRLHTLAQGGTAVGTGINAHPEFGRRFADEMSKKTHISFSTSDNYFESLSCQDTAVELSGQMKTLAVSLMKISNDLRWMNSGPLAGLAEINLPALQPGSSIMPGKVNPVIPEAVCMVCAQIMGYDTAITVAGQAGNFQLNVMLPIVGYNLLQGLSLLTHSAQALADDAIAGFTVNKEQIDHALNKNPILVTALNSVIGYEQGAKIAKEAYKEKRPVLEVAKEMTDLSEDELKRLLDPTDLTKGGIHK